MPGVLRKYLLQNSCEVNKIGTTEPIDTPIVWPNELQVDAYPTLFLYAIRNYFIKLCVGYQNGKQKHLLL